MSSSNYVETVANSIIKQLEMGTAPWVKPWSPGQRFMPFNPVTGNEYHGMNALWLLSVMEEKGYSDNRWMTYKQANGVDAQVNRGEKGTQIQYWKWTDEVPLQDENGKPLKDENGKALKQTVRLQKPRVWAATVFNAEQVAGLPEKIELAIPEELERHQEAEAILADSQAKIVYHSGDRAFYRPATDTITLPERAQFSSMDAFYATALHELGHWSGHESRLDRDIRHPFGSVGYAKEELRAEIASLMIGEELAIGHDPQQHVAYISTWVQVLQDDPREIFRASADAERIKKYLLGREMLKEKDQQQEEVEIPVLVPAVDVALQTTPDRVYLAVPFVEKNDAKALGAKWDRAEKSWYVPAGVNLEPFKQWLETDREIKVEPSKSPEVEFTEALESAGLVLSEAPIMDGELRRVPVEGDSQGQKSGAYVGFLDGHPAGYINNYKTGYEARWKSSQRQSAIGKEDKIRLEAEAAEKRAARAREREQLQERTASLVADVWSASELAETHPYLETKGVKPYGLRLNNSGSATLDGLDPEEEPQIWSNKGELLVPVQDINGKLLGAQSIDQDGRKSFPRGGRLHAGHHLLGTIDSADKVLVAEGYATAATLHEATGLPVAVAFHAGNLAAVAQAFREKHPDLTLVIAADNDHSKPHDRNVGVLKARSAAALVGGHVLLPSFEPGSRGSDWNDVGKLQGTAELRSQLTASLRVIDRQVKFAQALMQPEKNQEKQQPNLDHSTKQTAAPRAEQTISI